MNKFLQLFAILLLLSCGVCAQPRTWKTFSPVAGDWSILAPGVMNPDQEALEPASTMGSYSYADTNGFFAVIYKDTPDGRLLWKPLKKAHFKKVRKDFIKSSGGQLLREEDFSNGSISGREVYIKVPEGKLLGRESQLETQYRVQRLRMFFDDRRFYLVLAVLPENQITTSVVNKYFDSFVIK